MTSFIQTGISASEDGIVENSVISIFQSHIKPRAPNFITKIPNKRFSTNPPAHIIPESIKQFINMKNIAFKPSSNNDNTYKKLLDQKKISNILTIKKSSMIISPIQNKICSRISQFRMNSNSTNISNTSVNNQNKKIICNDYNFVQNSQPKIDKTQKNIKIDDITRVHDNSVPFLITSKKNTIKGVASNTKKLNLYYLTRLEKKHLKSKEKKIFSPIIRSPSRQGNQIEIIHFISFFRSRQSSYYMY